MPVDLKEGTQWHTSTFTSTKKQRFELANRHPLAPQQITRVMSNGRFVDGEARDKEVVAVQYLIFPIPRVQLA